MQGVLYWLKERLRDVLLWPLNLIRDFPARSGRLAVTLVRAGKAVILAPLLVWRALREQTFQEVFPQWLWQTGGWCHLFGVQLFDLVGGPEICQFVMHLGMQTSPLTVAQRTAVQAVFGSHNLRYQDVRLARGGLLNFVFRHNGGLAFATWYTIHLPIIEKEGRRGNGRNNLPLLIHELTHVFQYHHVGSRYLGEAIYYLITTQRNCYQYGGFVGLQSCWQQGQKFSQFNREQQAQIIQDYFARLQTGQDTSAYLPYLTQLQQRNL